MSESMLFERIYASLRDVINPQSHMLIDPVVKNICYEYEQRIAYLEEYKLHGDNLNEEDSETIEEYVWREERLKKRIADLERTNLLLADQLKKREGMWLAPNEADDDMLVSGQEAFVCIPRGPLEDCKESSAIYKAMRDNWLERQK